MYLKMSLKMSELGFQLALELALELYKLYELYELCELALELYKLYGKRSGSFPVPQVSKSITESSAVRPSPKMPTTEQCEAPT